MSLPIGLLFAALAMAPTPPPTPDFQWGKMPAEIQWVAECEWIVEGK